MAALTPKTITLIATLGTEPQVVTATLDLLYNQGESIRSVAVVHTVAPSNPPIQNAVQTLQQVAQGESYPALRFTFHPITGPNGQPYEDVESEPASRAAFTLLYRLVRQAKLSREKVHLCIAGGRKVTSIFGMAVAQLLFDEEDCLWHLYSSGEFLESKRLHPQPGDEVHLLRIPVALWSSVSPILLDIAKVDDPYQAYERQRSSKLHEEYQRAKRFVEGELTHSERQAVALLVQEMLSDEEIARRLHKSKRTIEQQLRTAYRKARDYYQVGEVGRVHLIALLKIYYTLREERG
ncbi:MAG: CRISPR-associated ring nuclease [Anaerolineales bacterium]|nr:CRISPR-associated ring nuclease [Anaerolineales bacterium]